MYDDDPFANPFDDPFGEPRRRGRVPRAEPLPPLEPHAEESILSQLGQTALGGLGYIGGSLDKAFGGRAIRNVVGGLTGNTDFNARELLSIIPFSDALGITDERQAVSGRDVVGFDKDDDSWGATLGGLGAEILMDPSTYLTLGGNTLLGKAAAKAGVMPKSVVPTTTRITSNPFASRFEGQLARNMRGATAGSEAGGIAAAANRNLMGPVTPGMAADVTGQPLSALATFSLPFGERLGVPGILALGTGKRAQRFANRMSGAKDWLTYSKLGRAVTPLFDARLSEFGAPAADEATQRVVRAEADEFTNRLAPLREQHVAERQVLVDAGIDINDPAAMNPVNQAMRQFQEGYQPTTPLAPELEDLVVRQLQEGVARRDAAAEVGRLAGRAADDYTNYGPRGLTKLTDEGLNDPALRPALAPHNPNDISRIPALTNIPGGTAGGINPLLGDDPLPGLNDLFTDPKTKAIPGDKKSFAATTKYIRDKYLRFGPQEEFEYANLKHMATHTPLTPQQSERLAELSRIVDQSQELAQKSMSEIQRTYDAGIAQAAAGGQPPAQFAIDTHASLVDAGTAPFQNATLADWHNYRINDEKSNAAARVVMRTLKENLSASGGPGMTKVKDVLKAAGYNNKNARNVIGKANLNKFVPNAIAADLAQKATSAFEKPSVLAPILSMADSLTNLNKAFQTKFFPSTMMRNMLGEQAVNLGAGTGNLVADAGDAMRVRAGTGLSSLGHLPEFFGMAPDEALKHYDELAFIHGVQQPWGRAAMDDIIGAGALDTGRPGALAPLGDRGNLIHAARDAGSQIAQGARDAWAHLRQPGGWNPLSWNWGGDNAINPLAMAGVGGRGETTNAAGFLGEQVMQAGDQMGKHGAFLGLLKQGHVPSVAAQKALSLRMGARKLAPFENEVMRRLVPYYRWTSHNIPHQLGELATNPGGFVGQSVRASNAIRQNEGIMPDWIGQGLAVPIGDRDESGTQRYLSTLGLPFEDLQNVASTGPNATQRTGQKLASMLNPLLKTPLEQIFGTQLHSGRELSDLYARSGMPTVEGWLGATPLSRPLNVISTMLDPRKGVLGAAANVFSPGRITDVDMNRASQIQGRRLLEEELRTNPLIREHTDLYVPAEQRAQMSPEDLQLLQLYRTLLARARQQRPAAAQ